MVVSLAVLAHDMSARAGDVLMGIAVFPIGWTYSASFEKLGDGQIMSTFSQHSANEREGEIPQARKITCRQQNTVQLTTIMKITVNI